LFHRESLSKRRAKDANRATEEAAIEKSVASIARHGFLNARRCYYEETRLQRILRDL
jgi:hypothetical protein